MTPNQRLRLEDMILWHTQRANDLVGTRPARHHAAKAASLRAALAELDRLCARERERALAPEARLQ